MCHNNASAFTAARWMLILIFICSVVVTVMAKSKPLRGSTGTNNGTGYVHSDPTDALQHNQTESLDFHPQSGATIRGNSSAESNPVHASPVANSASPASTPAALPPTGPSTTTQQPFHVAADDLDVFHYEDDSNNGTAARRTGSEGDLCSQICNATKQEIVKDDCDCQCPAKGPAASTTTATPTVEPPILDEEIADLERAINRMCAKLREKLEITARTTGAFLDTLRDDCTVNFFYGFNGSLWQQESSFEWTTVESTGAVTATHTVFGSFDPEGGFHSTGIWKPTKESYRTLPKYEHGERISTGLQNFTLSPALEITQH